MMLPIILIACATFISTLCGGLFALKHKDRLHLILGFSAGAVIAVAFFDLMPEALRLTTNKFDPSTILAVVVLGFAGYLVLDRIVGLHHHDHEHDKSHGHEESSSTRGKVGASSLSIHSFLDGAAIGLAFQVSASVGAIVATAVLVHDFSDGINTVNLILKNAGNRKEAFRWLLVDAFAPVLGVISTMWFVLPEDKLGIILALFSGFFLYIGASDLLPESYHRHPTFWTTSMTILGFLVLYTAIKIAG